MQWVVPSMLVTLVVFGGSKKWDSLVPYIQFLDNLSFARFKSNSPSKKWMQDTNESHFIWSTKVRNTTKVRSIDGSKIEFIDPEPYKAIDSGNRQRDKYSIEKLTLLTCCYEQEVASFPLSIVSWTFVLVSETSGWFLTVFLSLWSFDNVLHSHTQFYTL